MAETIWELINNKEKYQYYVQQSLKRAQDFSVPAITEQLTTLLQTFNHD